MIPRAELDAASVWAAASRALIADGGRLDAELRRGGLAMMAAADEAERAVYRDAVADVVEAARASAAEAGRIAADGMWRASFGSEPAAHANEAGIGLAHDQVFRDAACLFDGTMDAAAFSRRVRAWLSGEFAKSYDWAMGDSQRAMGGSEVRYAHVPAGPKPCIHCLEMASKGFSYEQPPRAENHPGCQCVVVPGTAATRVEGYDPDAAFDNLREILGRAKHIPHVGMEPGAKPSAKEKVVAFIVSNDEVPAFFIKETNKTGVKTPDAWIGDELWEFKVPEEWNEKTVKNQFKKALGKGTSRLLISGTENGATVDQMEKYVTDIFNDGEFREIGFVMLVDRVSKKTLCRE